MNTTLATLVAIASVVILFAVGCTSNKQYRTNFQPCNPSEPGGTCRNPVIEATPDYKMGVVEFDDQGWFWDTNQLIAVEKMIRVEARIGETNLPQGIVIIAFTHGWKNNAAMDNTNVEMFRATLQQFGKAEHEQTNHAPREVIGVYAGWRGLSAEIEPFKELSFWERKNTAHKVGGYGALTEMLATLEKLQEASNNSLASNAPRTELIIVGHSFGGAAVYSAISEITAQRFVDTVEQGKPLKPLGDQVILLNPAFEASRHFNLNQMAVSLDSYPTNQRPVLSIFTSKGDWATHYFFPLGRFFSTIFEKNRDGEQRRANRQAVGWFQPFVTHDLYYHQHGNPPADGTAAAAEPQAETPHLHDNSQLQEAINNVYRQKKNWHPNSDTNATYNFFDTTLKPRERYKEGNPILVVSVSKKIMKDHDDITNPRLINFLAEYILFCQNEPPRPSSK